MGMERVVTDLSTLDLFTVGIGPSSSHTVGPMKAAALFVDELRLLGALEAVVRVEAQLFGSLGATGQGHGTDRAVMLGLEGQAPDTVDPATIGERIAQIASSHRLVLGAEHLIDFDPPVDVVFHRRRSLPIHPNGMIFTAWGVDQVELLVSTSYSIGGGFIADEWGVPVRTGRREVPIPLPFATGAELLERCAETGLSISGVMRRNDAELHGERELGSSISAIWAAMRECVANGCSAPESLLPGGLRVPRRAPALFAELTLAPDDPAHVSDWVSLFALAVNEENASGGRVVTAPTNGAAGIIPAVLHYYAKFVTGADDAGVERFLLTAAAIGTLFKKNASISGAEVGCQGEVGSACSMAAAGLCEVLGGTPAQVENAAEIGLEHHLGLTCDPIGGLVQIPCIERNAIASNTAITAARLALRGDGTHKVSLDSAIRTMRDTGADMKSKYKETSRGGLAVNVVEC
ncbi:MAG: L-serine ammonia-lyase [Actinomycetota bacterium]|nr:L-serine ammonia-lyase [Actinomycetota bacterium]